MPLLNRLKKLEKHAKKLPDPRCICFPHDEPPRLYQKVERQSGLSVLCPLHGPRFRAFAPSVYQIHFAHLAPCTFTTGSRQYQKAMRASFPEDRWPAKVVYANGGIEIFVLKDGTEVRRRQLSPTYDYATNKPITNEGKWLYLTYDRKEIYLAPPEGGRDPVAAESWAPFAAEPPKEFVPQGSGSDAIETADKDWNADREITLEIDLRLENY